MRIVAINASHRGSQGLTAFFLSHLQAGASTAGASWETLTLARLKINRCLSCYQCQTGRAHLTCVYQDKDDAQSVFDQMAGADLIIYATPIYLLTMTGLLKNLLDRTYATMDIAEARLSNGLIHHRINPAISSKPFVPLIVCANLETGSWSNAADYFRRYARFMETRAAGWLVRNASGLFDFERDSSLPRRYPKVLDVITAFRQAGHELATRGRLSWRTQTRASQEVIPVPFFWLLKHLPPVKARVVKALNAGALRPPE